MPLATITEAKYTEAVLDEDIEPKSNDEAEAVREGVLEGEDVDREIIEALSVRRKWEQGDNSDHRPARAMKGVTITFYLEGDTQKSYQRFLSEEWIRQYLQDKTGKRCPPLSKDDLTFFAKSLALRNAPIRIEAFDASVDLEQIKVYESSNQAPSDPINK